MAKIDITKTELVWPGKYNEDGTLKEVPRVNLPFQVIETVNESRATREAKKYGGVQTSLFDIYEGNEGDTFMQGWVAYRTRKDRTLPLISDSNTYEKPGKYRVLVKVIDIFGNDTSQALDVEVK